MSDKDNFLKTYQHLLFSGTEAIQNISPNSTRSCLILTHQASLNTLDNDAVCKILDTNVGRYLAKNSNRSKEMQETIRQKLASTSQVSVPLCSKLNKSNVTLTDENCFKEGYCKKSETIDNTQFKHFLQMIFKKKEVVQPTPEPTSPPKQRKLNSDAKGVSDFKTVAELMGKKSTNASNNIQKRTLGLRRTISNNKFVSPVLSKNNSKEELKCSQENNEDDERLKNIDPRMVELILSEIMDTNPSLTWDDIAGLEFAKNAIQEAVVWPMLRPDLFTGLRRPPKGILLFGPPGTGKTLIGKCVASQSKSTFFSISASSLTSKWIGDSEKMVRALFSVARCRQPAVVFIDEIDSLLCQRSETEHESSRRLKTEFLVQLDGATTDSDERLLIIGATNRPQELDEAARRRFVKRLYIPLPERNARYQLVQRLMLKENHCLSDSNIQSIAEMTDGYSGADMKTLCTEASMGPLRSLNFATIQNIQATEVRPISMDDFTKALNMVKSSVSNTDLNEFVKWNNTFGSNTGAL